MFWIVILSYEFRSLGQKNVTLFSGNGDDKKIFTRAAAKKFFINLIEFFEQSLHLKNYSNSTFLFWKTKNPVYYCLKGKIRKFVRINLLLEIFLFVCMSFWNKKYVFSYILDLCERVGDKKIFTRPIYGNKTTFSGLIIIKL